MIGKALIQKDRIEFFKVVQNLEISLTDLVDYYINYLGPIFGDQKTYFKRRFAQFFAENALDFENYELIRPNGVINEDFIRQFFPAFAASYYSPRPIDSLAKLELLPGSENELKNTNLPVALNHRSGRPSRSPLVAYARTGGSLFVSPNGYQYFDEQLGCFWPHASLRPYSKAVAAIPRQPMSGLVILIQDTGDGTNFAHFTFDWVTRIMHILALGLIDKANATFVMGGDRTEYHSVILAALQKIYALRDEQFYFPSHREVLAVNGTFVFFSDQSLWPLHPAQMAHPCSMKFLNEIGKTIPHLAIAGPKRIFISRSDASLRKISNEDELIRIAIGLDFTIVRMTDFSAQEQIDLMRGVRIVVGAHGMGLTHTVFHEGPLTLLELFHPQLGTDAYSMIARARNFNYDYVIGTQIDDNKASYHIDPALFLDKMTAIVQGAAS